ncbi:MAG TPA: sodium/solute symporter [Pirellulaceae bacterium]|nr:sodium/solute symporter [Pirellulaceae bacterium]
MFLAATNLLTLPDYLIIALYLLGTITIGVTIGIRMKTGTDFFLGGRRLPWWAIGMSLVATDIGGTDIIGVGGAAYSHGLAVANFEWIGCVPAMIVGAFVFIPFFYRAGVYTIPEFLERRYNAGVRTVMAVCWLLFMACNLGIMLLASAKMMSAVFGWNEATCIIVTAILVGGYTFIGGLAAVVYTDTIQCAVMIAGCLLILVLGLIKVGGIGELKARLAEAEVRENAATAVEMAKVSEDRSDTVEMTVVTEASTTERTSLILPADTQTPFPWPGIYFGLALILSPAYWIGNQAIVQRSLGARSEFEARASYIWGALLKNVIPLIVAVPGLIAVALLPDLKDGDSAIPNLVGELLPAGLRGLFVAAFLAALMSSIDSYLNSAATLVSNDLYKPFINRDVTDQQLLSIGRITTVGLVAWAVGFAFLLATMSEASGIYAIFQTLMAFFQGPAFAILLIGILWRRATGNAALIALLSGIATSISLYALNQPAIFGALGLEPLFKIQEPFLYFSIWAFAVTAVVLVVLSLLSGPVEADKLQYVFGGHSEASTAAAPDVQAVATEAKGATT